MNELFERGKWAGRAEGRREALKGVVKSLRNRGFKPKEIADMIDLKESSVRSLYNEDVNKQKKRKGGCNSPSNFSRKIHDT